MPPIFIPCPASPHQSDPVMAFKYAPYLKRCLLLVQRRFCACIAEGWMLQAPERSE